VPRLVPAERQAGAVVALDVDLRSAEGLREPRHELQRRGKVGQRSARQPGHLVAQLGGAVGANGEGHDSFHFGVRGLVTAFISSSYPSSIQSGRAATSHRSPKFQGQSFFSSFFALLFHTPYRRPSAPGQAWMSISMACSVRRASSVSPASACSVASRYSPSGCRQRWTCFSRCSCAASRCCVSHSHAAVRQRDVAELVLRIGLQDLLQPRGGLGELLALDFDEGRPPQRLEVAGVFFEGLQVRGAGASGWPTSRRASPY